MTGCTNALNKIRPTDMSIQNKLRRKKRSCAAYLKEK
jgi:hypothetical protein